MRTLVLLLLTLAPGLLAEGPEFEVASIKPFTIPADGKISPGLITPRDGPGTADPTHMSRQATLLRTLVMDAFDVRNYQVMGPDTLTETRFDFSVVLPEGATKDDVKSMWRNLLVSRFGMKYHTEQREFQVYELIVGPRGHRLTENNDSPPPGQPAGAARVATKDGVPSLSSAGIATRLRTGPNGVTGTLVVQQQPISALVTMLSSALGNPVIDKTGLTGKYDFSVEYSDPRMLGSAGRGANASAPTSVTAAEPALDLPSAVQQKLGLRLVKSKGKLDVIVVEKIERVPTEN